MYKAYINRGNNNDKNNNKETIRKIVSLRLEKANLLGFNNYANFVLDETMAKNDSNVMSLLNNLWSCALPKAKAEAAELQQLMDKEGKGEKLEAWDWWYYTEKLRKEKYNLSEEDTKPYFKLENVREGAFAVANKLYGIKPCKYAKSADGTGVATATAKQLALPLSDVDLGRNPLLGTAPVAYQFGEREVNTADLYN